MRIKTLGFVSVKDAPSGCLIAYPNGTIVVVSEYHTTKADGSFSRDCYIVNSGEYFCGDVNEKGLLIEIDMGYECQEGD